MRIRRPGSAEGSSEKPSKGSDPMKPRMSEDSYKNEPEGVAIISFTGRFPGARTVEEFWRNLRNGVESVRFFSDEELISSGVKPELLKRPDYVKAGTVLEGIDLFDADFFHYSPREASILDPQQRIFLELAWEALEKAGYDPRNCPGVVCVYAGASLSEYLLRVLSSHGNTELLNTLQTGIGNDKDYLSSRVSYALNLKGPSVTVQTACSTSLVAVHMACESL